MWAELAWVALVLVHTPPALATFSRRLRQRMYAVEAAGALDIILVHRGVLFLAVALCCAFAALNAEARPVATLVAGISLLGFLLTYALAGAPRGPLRVIALVDSVALAPLALVVTDAWP